MLPNECYTRIKPVNIEPCLRVLDQLEFHDTESKCAQVTQEGSLFPSAVYFLLRDLGLGGKTFRVFCRKLGPHQGIAPHVDAHEWMNGCLIRRFHIPLTSHPDIKMRWPDDGVEVHLEPGYLWEVRYDRKHEVVNNTDSERIHIQIDQQYPLTR